MAGGSSFERLVAEAEAHPVRGWDFSWLGSRMVTNPLAWEFDSLVLRHARTSPDLLDLGTGGGEWLAALPHRPPHTVATEGWEPNLDVARERLGPLGVSVVHVEAPPDNAEQEEGETRARLPFPDESFRLVACRHESFVAAEVARILVRGGVFLTQQVGGEYGDFHRLLGLPPPRRPARVWNLALATRQVEDAGLEVVTSAEDAQATSFSDVGALIWYLRAVPWTVPGFSAGQHLASLRELQTRLERDGPAIVRLPAFYLEAIKRAVTRG